MPRNEICRSCNGAYHDDEMAGDDLCIYCESGLDAIDEARAEEAAIDARGER